MVEIFVSLIELLVNSNKDVLTMTPLGYSALIENHALPVPGLTQIYTLSPKTGVAKH